MLICLAGFPVGAEALAHPYRGCARAVSSSVFAGATTLWPAQERVFGGAQAEGEELIGQTIEHAGDDLGVLAARRFEQGAGGEVAGREARAAWRDRCALHLSIVVSRNRADGGIEHGEAQRFEDFAGMSVADQGVKVIAGKAALTPVTQGDDHLRTEGLVVLQAPVRDIGDQFLHLWIAALAQAFKGQADRFQIARQAGELPCGWLAEQAIVLLCDGMKQARMTNGLCGIVGQDLEAQRGHHVSRFPMRSSWLVSFLRTDPGPSQDRIRETRQKTARAAGLHMSCGATPLSRAQTERREREARLPELRGPDRARG